MHEETNRKTIHLPSDGLEGRQLSGWWTARRVGRSLIIRIRRIEWAIGRNPSKDKVFQENKSPLDNVSRLVYMVNRTRWFADHCAGLCDDLPLAVSSQKILDPNEQEGEIILLSELYGELSELAQDQNRKKEWLPQHCLHGWPQFPPGKNHLLCRILQKRIPNCPRSWKSAKPNLRPH